MAHPHMSVGVNLSLSIKWSQSM